MDGRRAFGNRGEDLAAAHLRGLGMRVLGRQDRTPFGEIDLVLEDGDEIVFAEVKARRTGTFGHPEEAITPAKFMHMRRSAEAWLSERHMEARPARLDVVAIRFREGSAPEIVHFPAIDGPCGA